MKLEKIVLSKLASFFIRQSALTFLLFVIIVAVRCTKRIPQPSPFHKVKRNNSKDSVEMRPCLQTGSQAHLLAFENPYYDVIAAMGLDDDIEEDYYNPLYEMPSDSETDPEDVYFTYRPANRHNHHHHHRHYHRNNQFQYEGGKDRGLSQ